MRGNTTRARQHHQVLAALRAAYAIDFTAEQAVPERLTREEQVEAAAFELYAAGPWGTFEGVSGATLRTVTCSHSMDVYREMVREVLSALAAEEK